MATSEPGSQLRKDPLANEWVIIAPGRGYRPHEGIRPVPECPFCPGNEGLTPPNLLLLQAEGSADPWFVRVVENLFPIAAGQGHHPAEAGDSLLRLTAAAGVHEVVIETPHHDQEMAGREPPQLALTLRAYQARLSALMARPEIRQVVVFKNKGAAAGTSLPHPHSQIVGLARVSNASLRRVRAARRHYRIWGRCLLCELAQAERRTRERIILDDEGFIAFAPFAQSFAGQLHLVPLRHMPSFAMASEEEVAALSRCLQVLLAKVDAGLDQPPYNLILRESPKPWHLDPAVHWYLELIPRLTQFGGFELATGIPVNPLSPEAFVREYLGRP